MTKKSPQQHHPDFSSLSGIMEHFSRVPFNQFQSELNEWFCKSLAEKGVDLHKLNGQDTTGFPEQLRKFVEEIYSRAETLSQKDD